MSPPFCLLLPDAFRHCNNVWCEEWIQLYLFPYGSSSCSITMYSKVCLFYTLECLPASQTKCHRQLVYFCVLHSACWSISVCIANGAAVTTEASICFSYTEGNFLHVVALLQGWCDYSCLLITFTINLSSSKKKLDGIFTAQIYLIFPVNFVK